MPIDSGLIQAVIDEPLPSGSGFEALGLVDTALPGTLTFLDTQKFVDALVANENITGVITSADLASELRLRRPGLQTLVAKDPRWSYYTLYNQVARARYQRLPSRIDPTATIHPTASVSEHNVEVGPRTVIGPNVTILPDVRIGADCVIQPGTVIGSEGFEVKRTSKGILPVFHDGEVIIEDGVQIGANTCIDKGFWKKPTLIEAEANVDNLVHVAHSARIGSGAFVIAGTVLGGASRIGSGAWLSINTSVAPGMVVGDRAFISIGAVVTRHVADDEQVTGNFAVPHKTFLKILKANLKAVAES